MGGVLQYGTRVPLPVLRLKGDILVQSRGNQIPSLLFAN